MPLIQVNINGRNYEVACGEGQEDHLRSLAQSVNDRAVELVQANGAIDEARLLLMASLLLADDLRVEQAKLADTQMKLQNAQLAVEQAAVSGDANMERATNYIADVFDDISDRLEGVVTKFEA